MLQMWSIDYSIPETNTPLITLKKSLKSCGEIVFLIFKTCENLDGIQASQLSKNK